MKRTIPLQRGAGLQRRTALARTKALEDRTQLRRRAAAQRAVAKQQRRRVDTGPDDATKTLLWIRAEGRCELCHRPVGGLNGLPFSRHHRRPRGMGGSSAPWVNDVSNLLLVCGTATTPDGCHRMIETSRLVAYDNGWLIGYSSQYLPAEVPVRIARIGVVYLTDDGHYAPGAA